MDDFQKFEQRKPTLDLYDKQERTAKIFKWVTMPIFWPVYLWNALDTRISRRKIWSSH